MQFDRSARLIMNIVYLLITIMGVIGLVWLTKFSFQARLDGSVACVDGITEAKLAFTKVAVTLLWIQIVFSVLTAIWASTK